MKPDDKTRIRTVIGKLLHYRKWNMQHGYGKNPAELGKIVDRVQRYFEHYKGKDDRAHWNLLVVLREDIERIIPSDGSSRTLLKKQAKELIAEAMGKEVAVG